MGCSEPQPLEMLTATFSFFNAKKLLGTFQTFQSKIRQVLLKNFNFKIVKKIEQVTENHRKFSQNFDWNPAPLGAIKLKRLQRIFGIN